MYIYIYALYIYILVLSPPHFVTCHFYNQCVTFFNKNGVFACIKPLAPDWNLLHLADSSILSAPLRLLHATLPPQTSFHCYTSNQFTVATHSLCLWSPRCHSPWTLIHCYHSAAGNYISNSWELKAVTVTVILNSSSTDHFVIKDAPIPTGSSLELIDSGSKIVMQNTDVLKAYADTGSAVDVLVSYVDAIST